jgi:hypothetical protein
MRATLKAVRSKCGASVVPASDRAMRRRSFAVAMRGLQVREPMQQEIPAVANSRFRSVHICDSNGASEGSGIAPGWLTG